MRIAYADPPYQGESKQFYGDHADYAGEVDHAALIARLRSEFPDGWALSCKTSSLRELLPLCPQKYRLLAWCKPNAAFKKNVGLAYAWEPVIVVGGRKRSHTDGFVLDWNIVPATVTAATFIGAKPQKFSVWLFQAMNLKGEDELVDLFPGTRGVTRAWDAYRDQLQLEGIA